MTRKDDRPGDAAELRRRAEEMDRGRAAQAPDNLEALSPEEIRRTLHELRVHQIELELQNEELRQAQAELDAARARYFDLYDLAPVGYCTVSEQGLILEANLTAAALLGVARSALVQQPLTSFILPEDQDIYYLYRKQLPEAGAPQACELRMVEADGTAFWARLEATVAEAAGGAPVCRVVMSDITERKRTEEALQKAWTKSAPAREPRKKKAHRTDKDDRPGEGPGLRRRAGRSDGREGRRRPGKEENPAARRKPGRRSTNCGCIRSSSRCRTRNCAGRRWNWTPRGRAISTSTIWRRWAIAPSARRG